MPERHTAHAALLLTGSSRQSFSASCVGVLEFSPSSGSASTAEQPAWNLLLAPIFEVCRQVPSHCQQQLAMPEQRLLQVPLRWQWIQQPSPWRAACMKATVAAIGASTWWQRTAWQDQGPSRLQRRHLQLPSHCSRQLRQRLDSRGTLQLQQAGLQCSHRRR